MKDSMKLIILEHALWNSPSYCGKFDEVTGNTRREYSLTGEHLTSVEQTTTKWYKQTQTNMECQIYDMNNKNIAVWLQPYFQHAPSQQ